ncbi:hypothetical protein BDY19DRAFT_992611 [Irpex rosettiformis]|uniref:Uncharacterized protein n=1 Tax=Irpex rosettiformis TaxID=378272 RepID=A0ACB8U8X4_9APHY|nr:hypothetical protein BDY19DRAFT_992611 [Irpex rosettiformis]
MDVNRDKGKGPELKIRGQAAAERQKNQAEDEAQDEHMPSPLERRESELKEQALRNKVVRTRKNSAAPTSSSS